VRLFATADYPGEVATIAERGEIVSTGELSGAAPISYAGHDAGRTVSGANLIMVVGPAYATEGFALAAAQHLTPEQAIVVCPTSCLGSFAFRRAAGLSHDDDRYLVGETSTLPYAVRMSGPATIHVFAKLRAGLWVAATPRSGTDRLRTMLGEVYPGIGAAGSVLTTTLQNGNPVIHPAVTLSNAALIERTGGDFNFYEDGITPAVGRLMQAVDSERMAIAAALGRRSRRTPPSE
jgi:opine dehydrogenase